MLRAVWPAFERLAPGSPLGWLVAARLGDERLAAALRRLPVRSEDSFFLYAVLLWGPVVGTAVFFLARDLLGAFTETWLLWYGLMFMGIVLFKPEGVVGAWQDLVRRTRTAGTAKGAGFLSRFRG